MTVLYLIISLSILILVHEWGHFVVARLFKVRVEKFSLGFGPKIWGIKKGDTEYKISAILFGGYVKMSGDDPAELDKNDEHAFLNQKVWKRACVVAAGPIMNIVLCVVLMPIVFMIGKSEPAFYYEPAMVEQVMADSPATKAGIKVGDTFVSIGGKEIENWKELIDGVLIAKGETLPYTVERRGAEVSGTVDVEKMPTGPGGYIGVEPTLYIGDEATVDMVSPLSPAEDAGLKPGDKIVSINGRKIIGFTEMLKLIDESKGEPIFLGVDRAGSDIDIRLVPEYNEDLGRYVMGITKDLTKVDIPTVTVRYGFFASIKKGMSEVVRLAGLTFKILKKLVTLQLSYKALGGPIKIAQIAAAAARTGIGSFIFLLSFLSMQLGFLNLLPIPVLDGGHLVFFGIEAVRRRPLSERAQGIAQHIGLALIVLLLVLVSFNDLMGIESVRRLVDRIF